LIERRKTSELIELIDSMPAVALLGPRQAGKTTLAQGIGEGRKAHYLDLESDTGRARLADPEAYLAEYADHLVILDEVQRMPGLFQNLRGFPRSR
jgi:predicted AAA+ superfamily ATPase